MKIAFVTDFHLGFHPNGREQDAFNNAVSAVEAAVKENIDAIVFNGDFFHHDVPKQEILLEAFKLLIIARDAADSAAKIEITGKKGIRKPEFEGIPFIAIHGTHEFRGHDFTNVLEIFDKAGFMIYIHAEKLVLSKHRERVALHGLGGVPEKKALDALLHWKPEPEENAFNILLLHQSLKEFMPFEDEMVATISLGDLPQGFDLVVNGHLHWSSEVKEKNLHLLMPGSTVVTQMKNLESKKKKVWFLLDTKSGELTEKIIAGQRPFHYSKIELLQANPETVREKVESEIKGLIRGEHLEKPLVKIKVVGSLAKGFNESDLKLNDFVEKFKHEAIVSVTSNFREESFKKKISELSALQAEKKSISELGLEILEKNLEETEFNKAFDSRRLFSLLKEDESAKALSMVSELTPRKKPPKNNQTTIKNE